MHMEFVGVSMEILSGRSKHKYLGKTLVGDLRHRAEVELGCPYRCLVGGGWDPGSICLIKLSPLQYCFFQNSSVNDALRLLFCY